MAELVRRDPDVVDLAALGARGIEDFLDGARGLVTGDRARPLRARAGRESLRVPLPGTPDEAGQRRELPRGAGTGWIRVHAWRSGPLALARARLSSPRSTSPAARRWNLACHLLAQGVVAPRPLALLERVEGMHVRSVLVEAELEDFEPLAGWLERTPPGPARRRGLRALGLSLAALLRSGAWLRGSTADDVLVTGASADDSDCAAVTLARLQDEHAQWRERGLTPARLPSVAFCGLDDGVLRKSIAPRRRLAWLLRQERSLPPSARLTDRERARLALTALGSPTSKPLVRQDCRARATASASTAS